MPLYAVADFCLIPMATSTPSVGIYIAECQRVLQSMKEEGIKYEMHGYGTNLEGPFPLVSKAIERCHEAVHKLGAPRIATDIRLGTRVDKLGPGQEQTLQSLPQSNEATTMTSQDREGEEEQSNWAEGLGENERKRESVRRILAKDAKRVAK